MIAGVWNGSRRWGLPTLSPWQFGGQSEGGTTGYALRRSAHGRGAGHGYEFLQRPDGLLVSFEPWAQIQGRR
jgi:hypothetical protein